TRFRPSKAPETISTCNLPSRPCTTIRWSGMLPSSIALISGLVILISTPDAFLAAYSAAYLPRIDHSIDVLVVAHPQTVELGVVLATQVDAFYVQILQLPHSLVIEEHLVLDLEAATVAGLDVHADVGGGRGIPVLHARGHNVVT